MVDYDTVKQKCVNLRKKVLRQLLVKPLERSVTFYNDVLPIIKDIMNLIGYPTFKINEGVNMWIPEAYMNYQANSIGFKTLPLQYNDEKVTVNGEEIIPFSVFDFNESIYRDRIKKGAVNLAKRTLVFGIPVSESPPDGDFEDALNVYYVPQGYTKFKTQVEDLETLLGEAPELPTMYDFGLFEPPITSYKAKKIVGSWDWFGYSGSIGTIHARISYDGLVSVINEEGKERAIIYKWALIVDNDTDYTVKIYYSNKEVFSSAHHRTAWVYIHDVKLETNLIVLGSVELT